MDTLSKRLCTIGIMVNVFFIWIVYFTRNFFVGLDKIEGFGNQANNYIPSLTNEKFYELISSTRVTLELIFIVVLTLMFSLAFMRIYKSKDKSALIYSFILIMMVGITDLFVHIGFSILKGSENFKSLWVEGLSPIASAMQYTVVVAILYVFCTFVSKKNVTRGR